jgi:crotonobetainyl-CoA:carnitine CoA-transferase CaiB-like acyl-CoA transferase
MTVPSGTSPLAGVRVVDLSRVLAGPYATMTLADLGADVAKVEHPVGGDETRSWGPPYAGGESACRRRGRQRRALPPLVRGGPAARSRRRRPLRDERGPRTEP